MIHNYRNWMGCGFVGGIDKEREKYERQSRRGKNRKADFMLGGLHLIFSQHGGIVCGPACGFTATWWCETELLMLVKPHRDTVCHQSQHQKIKSVQER